MGSTDDEWETLPVMDEIHKAFNEENSHCDQQQTDTLLVEGVSVFDVKGKMVALGRLQRPTT